MLDWSHYILWGLAIQLKNIVYLKLYEAFAVTVATEIEISLKQYVGGWDDVIHEVTKSQTCHWLVTWQGGSTLVNNLTVVSHNIINPMMR